MLGSKRFLNRKEVIPMLETVLVLATIAVALVVIGALIQVRTNRQAQFDQAIESRIERFCK